MTITFELHGVQRILPFDAAADLSLQQWAAKALGTGDTLSVTDAQTLAVLVAAATELLLERVLLENPTPAMVVIETEKQAALAKATADIRAAALASVQAG